MATPSFTAPTRLRGVVDDTAYYTILGDVLENVPDVLFPTSVWTYTQMARDPQLAAVLKSYTLLIRRATWQVDPAGCRPDVAKLVADDLGLPLAGNDQPTAARVKGVSWREHLHAALTHLTYGFSTFELLADVSTGQARLVALSERPQHTINDVHVDPASGAFLGVDQTVLGFKPTAEIPADRLAHYTHDRQGANWLGTSLLRPAFGPHLLKRECQRILATSSRRFGMGVPVVEWAAGTNPTPTQVSQAQQMASAARVGDQGGASLPPGAKLALVGLTGSAPDTLAFIKWLDQQMSRMALAGHLDLGETSNGSRALGEAFTELLLMAIQSIADDLAEDVTRQVAARVVGWNWGGDEPVPRIVCGDVGAKHEITAEAMKALLDSGALTADPGLEAYLRRRYRLPERQEAAPAPVEPQPAAAARRTRKPSAPAEGQLPLPIGEETS